MVRFVSSLWYCAVVIRYSDIEALPLAVVQCIPLPSEIRIQSCERRGIQVTNVSVTGWENETCASILVINIAS